jgi:hypothetical protein
MRPLVNLAPEVTYRDVIFITIGAMQMTICHPVDHYIKPADNFFLYTPALAMYRHIISNLIILQYLAIGQCRIILTVVEHGPPNNMYGWLICRPMELFITKSHNGIVFVMGTATEVYHSRNSVISIQLMNRHNLNLREPQDRY